MKWIICVFVLVAILLNAPAANAQQETTIVVAPAIIDLAVKPGDSIQSTLTIRNGGGFALPISVSARSLIVEDEIIIESNRESSDASSWIAIDEPGFLLGDSESKTLMLSVNVPENANPGGHYAQISIRGLSLEKSSDVGSSIVIPEVAVTMLITVAGDVETSMKLDAGSIFPLFATPSATLLARFKVENKGNVHDLLTPILIVEKKGVEVYRKTLTPKVVLPNTKKVFDETLQLPDDYGLYEAHIQIPYANGQKLLLSNPETIIVAPSLWSIFTVAIITIGGLYTYNHRENLGKAWKALKDRPL